MQWFLQEQVEEVALMTTLVRVADRAGANLFDLENFVAREIDSAPAGIGAPHAAGGRLVTELAAAPVGACVLQPGLGAAGVVGGNPGHPDVAAEVDVFVLVDGPAVHRPALGARRGRRVAGYSRKADSDGPTAVAPTAVAALLVR